jgi:hypothetical protein
MRLEVYVIGQAPARFRSPNCIESLRNPAWQPQSCPGLSMPVSPQRLSIAPAQQAKMAQSRSGEEQNPSPADSFRAAGGRTWLRTPGEDSLPFDPPVMIRTSARRGDESAEWPAQALKRCADGHCCRPCTLLTTLRVVMRADGAMRPWRSHPCTTHAQCPPRPHQFERQSTQASVRRRSHAPTASTDLLTVRPKPCPTTGKGPCGRLPEKAEGN